MKLLRGICVSLAVLLAVVLPLAAQETSSAPPAEMSEGRLLRFPDSYGDKIAFTFAGDIWVVSKSGGVARRLTTSPGLELFPKFSPDGKYIAFTGQYDGNFNVYVIPSEGGQPRQITFLPDPLHENERMGPNNMVLNWTPDGKHILFLSRRETFNSWFGRPFTVGLDGGLPVRFPVDKGGLVSFSPDGNQIAYNRIFRNFRTWKRYTGGLAQRISIYNFKTNQYEEPNLGGYLGADTFPMWHGDTIYFDSDRGPDHRMNLYSYSLSSKDIKQLTHFKEFDVNWPSLGPDSIAFENGGYLYLYDLSSAQVRKVSVSLPGDFDQARPRWLNAAKWIQSFDISPEGKRAVFSARGDVFTVPEKEGATRDITRTSGAREQYATWSPDGRWIAYLSDASGEEEFYIRPQDGQGPEVRVTSDGAMHRLPPAWSPDSKKLLFADKSLRLFYVDINDKKPVLLDQGHFADLTDYNWSPDSKWVAYAKQSENGNGVIYLYSLADKKITPVTTSFYGSTNPVFDPDGKYLYFLSQRDFNEVLGVYDEEFANPKATRVYLVTLKADAPSPFAPKSDEETPKAVSASGASPSDSSAAKDKGAKDKDEMATKENKDDKDTNDKKDDKPAPFRIDLDGIGNRIVSLPTPPAVMQGLLAAKGFVYYLTMPVTGLSGPLPGEGPALHAFDLDKRKDDVLIDGADNFALSFNGKKILYSAPGQGGASDAGSDHTYGIVDAAPASAPHHSGDGALNLTGMQMQLDPHAEWKQIFNEVYRQERDFFFEPSMNGVDWAAERDKYAQLLPYAETRFDLNYILGELIGELSNSHTYVGDGDYPDLKPVNVGVLGVDFLADSSTGYYRFQKIYPGENWDSARRSPLTEPGVDVHQGDYLIAVDGRPLKAPQNPYEAFVNTANQNVILTVNSKPTPDGARMVTVRALPSEFRLRELDWIDGNRRKVDEASGGKIGYVYLPDMSAEGLNQFVKQYFPQIRKQGLIIDVRYNGGGFVDQMVLERLRRVLSGMQAARNFNSGTIPAVVFHGYMAAVTNEYAASDGDFFSYFFKQYHLGPLIGMRTWGGVRGIRGDIPLIDNGYITRPEFALYGTDSKWVIENHGVQPDIVVDNTPDQVMSGKDPQLQTAIDYLMKEIQANPKPLPPRPPDLPAYPPGPGF